MTTPAAMPSDALATMANLAMDIRKVIDDALNSAIPEPWEVSDHATKAILDLFAPILAEKEREREHYEAMVKHEQEAAIYWCGEAAKLNERALAAEAALAAVVEALEPFADEKNGAMQDILWGDQPDSATMTITCPLGQVRKAREVVRAAAIRAQGDSEG